LILAKYLNIIAINKEIVYNDPIESIMTQRSPSLVSEKIFANSLSNDPQRIPTKEK